MPDVVGLTGLLGRIDRRLRAGRDVHVVCAMGQSRSAMVVTNYVAAALRTTFREALAFVRYAYRDANPNPGFRDRSEEIRHQLAEAVEPIDVTALQLFTYHRCREPLWL